MPNATEDGARPPADALKLSIDFLFGRGFLTVRQQRLAHWGTLDELRMEVPDLRFPFDVQGGLHRFRQVRHHVHRLRYTLSENELARTLDAAADDISGFHAVQLRLAQGSLVLCAQVSLLSARGAIACRLAPAPALLDDPLTLQLVPVEYTTFGDLPLPAPLLLSELLGRLLHHARLQHPIPDWAPRLHGDVLQLRPSPMVLAGLFLPLGWKIPATERLTAETIDIRPGAIHILAAGRDGPHPSPHERHDVRDARSGRSAALALAGLEARAGLEATDQALFRGDLQNALDACRPIATSSAAPDVAVHRLLDLLLAAGTPEATAEASRIAGDRADRDPEDRIALQTLARLHPDDASITDRLLEALRAASMTPELILGAVATAESAMHRDHEDAGHRIASALRLAPRHPEALRLRIDHARRTGDLTSLEDTLRRRSSVAPTLPERIDHHLELARLALRRRGDAAEARAWLERARSLSPDTADIYTELAHAFLQEGRPADAVRALDTAATRYADAHDPAAAALARRRAATTWHQQLDQPDAALAELQRAWTLHPDPETAIELVDLAIAARRPDDALAPLQTALHTATAQPVPPDTLADLTERAARLDEARGRIDEAISRRRDLLHLRPADRANRSALERALVDAGRADEWVALHEELLDHCDPDEIPTLHASLARTLQETLDRPLRAAHHWRLVLTAQPDHHEALHRLRAIHADHQLWLELADALQAVIAEHPEHRAAPTLRAVAAEAASAGGDDTLAIDLARAAIAQHPEASAPWLAAASILPDEEAWHAAEQFADRTDDLPRAATLLRTLGDRAFTSSDGMRRAVRLYRRALLLVNDEDTRQRLRRAAEHCGMDPDRVLPPTATAPPRAQANSPAHDRTPPAPARDPSSAPPPARQPPAQQPPDDRAPTQHPSAPHALPPQTLANSPAPNRTPPEPAGDDESPAAPAGGAPGPRLVDTPPGGLDTDRPVDGAPPSTQARRIEGLRAELEVARHAESHGEVVRVLEELTGLVHEDGERARLCAELGSTLYHDLEESERARHWLEEAQRIDPDGEGQRFEVLTALEAIYEDVDAPDALLEVYRRKLEGAADPAMRDVFRLLMATVLFERLHRPREALALIDESLRDSAANIPALRLKAEIHEDQGDPSSAVRTLQHILDRPELDPFERQEVLRSLGRLEWRELGDHERAASRFEELLAQIPGDTDCLSALKQIHGARGAWDDCARVLWRELGLLIGRLDAFEDAGDVLALPESDVPALLRGTFARILAEAAEVLANDSNREELAAKLLDRAGQHGSSEPAVLEARIRVGQRLDDHAGVARAAEQLAELLLLSEERQQLQALAAEAWERAGFASRAAALRSAVASAEREGSRLSPHPATVSGPVERPPVDGKHGEDALRDPQIEAETARNDLRGDDEDVDELDGSTPAPAPQAGTLHTATDGTDGSTASVESFDPARAGTAERLSHLDRLARSERYAEALSAIESWLPMARDPVHRRELLLRKGRLLIDRSGTGRDAILVLKGALILDENAADTRFELMRAHARSGEFRLAMEQLRELSTILGSDLLSLDGLAPEIDRLRALGEPADVSRLDQWVRDVRPSGE
ncbi:MAG: tetratricopeptide repeat protein [Deltaproteobacteria bacterium]|nr:MAG: tetratricopeptide repeat protein [Deltaproteobacteria bacterium]